MRRCIGCMESKPKNELIRIAYSDGQLTADPTGRAPGRGVYICRDQACLDRAKKKKALQRGFGPKFTGEISGEAAEKVLNEIEELISDEQR